MRSRLSLMLPAAIAALCLAGSARAQVVTFSSSGPAGVMTHMGQVTLSDEAIRAMISSHESAVLQPNSEFNSVLLVVDANDQYVSSRATKSAVHTVEGGPGTTTFTVGDSGTARVVIRSTSDGSVPTVDAAAGTVVMSRTSDHAGENGVMGTGINMADVGSIGMKRYTAGQLTSGQLIVTVLKLK